MFTPGTPLSPNPTCQKKSRESIIQRIDYSHVLDPVVTTSSRK